MSVYKDLEPIDLTAIRTYELGSRPSKVTVDDFAKPVVENGSVADFLKKLPNILAVQSLRELAMQVRRARDRGKPIIWGFGGHVIKTGLAPIVIDLMRRGFVSAIATNGSVLVHDSEIAMVGFTSEDVDATLESGDFGASKETGELLNSAAVAGRNDAIGLGEADGRRLDSMQPHYADYSILCEAYRQKVPFTVHVTIGADIGPFHPTCDGGALGETSHRDFRLLCSIVKKLGGR